MSNVVQKGFPSLTSSAKKFFPIGSGVFVLLCGLLTAVPARSKEVPKEIAQVKITENLGKAVLDPPLQFEDDSGKSVYLSQYFSKKPVVLALAYFECPSLCTLVLNGMVDSFKGIDWGPGRDFEVVVLSIDPEEDAELAAAKKKSYIESYGKTVASEGWHFLVGKKDQIQQLADRLGFGFQYNPENGEYAHGAVLHLLTPDGRISRYLYGVQYSPKDLKLGLLEASGGKIGTVIERILLFCYRYDPVTRKYSIYLSRLMQAGGAGTVLVFGGYLAVFWRRQRRRKQKEPNSDAEGI